MDTLRMTRRFAESISAAEISKGNGRQEMRLIFHVGTCQPRDICAHVQKETIQNVDVVAYLLMNRRTNERTDYH